MKRNLLWLVIILILLTIWFSNLITLAVELKGNFNADVDDMQGAVTATQEIIGTILDVVRIIGMGIALIMLTYVGIKFMLASPSERANIKQYSMNFIIGAFILICGVGLLTIVKEFALTIGN